MPTTLTLEIGNAVFEPTDIAGLQGWWKADTIVGNDGDAVASWSDSSGNSRTLTQATGTSQPVLKKAANGINNVNVLNFDGVDDSIGRADALSITNVSTVFAVARPTAKGHIVKVGSNTTGFGFGMGRPDLDTNGPDLIGLLETVRWLNTGAGVAEVFPGSHVLVMSVNGTGVAPVLYKNGTSAGGPFSGASIVSAASQFQVGAGAARYIAGSIAEVVVYNSVLSATDRGSVTSYLGTKYGITVV